MLSAWQETAYFTTEERAALALAEAITGIGDHSALDASYRQADRILGSDQLAAVSWLAVAINAFNRIAVTSRYDVSP